MTSKQRACLKGMAMTMEPVAQIGKASLTDEGLNGVEEALEARELIKIAVLKNCDGDVRMIADTIAERLHGEVVQVIGRKIVLYRPARQKEKRRIVLPQ
ncbi:MAG: ribosome assembly RNA-binding protein YhbY [Lachnospiraceae bacterium]|jgi:RNA-binding protein|nr:ribosome assembly RNA-binding protein YhbY [Lachnospiraceae bacterium]